MLIKWEIRKIIWGHSKDNHKPDLSKMHTTVLKIVKWNELEFMPIMNYAVVIFMKC